MFMKIKDIMIVASLLLVACVPLQAQESTLKQFEQELKKGNANVTSIKSSFTQSRQMAVLANEVSKKGKFYFKTPSNMLLSFDDGDYIKMTPSWFEMKTSGKVSATKVDSNPMLRSLNAILSASVLGDFSQISKSFGVKAEPTASEWLVELTPRRGKAVAKVSKIVIRFDRKDMSINLLRMEEKSGDYTQYKFYDKQFNTKIESTLFDISKNKK